MTTDGQSRNAFPAYRIFVFGHEVTLDTTRVSVTYADNNQGPNTAEFVLASKNSRYVATAEDVARLNRLFGGIVNSFDDRVVDSVVDRFLSDLPGSSVEAAAGIAVSYIVDELLSDLRELTSDARRAIAELDDEVKRKILGAKIGKTQEFRGERTDVFSLEALRLLSRAEILEILRRAPVYPIYAGCPIFHTNDPVRIFMREVFTPEDGPADWHYAFAGFVSDWSIDISADNQQTVRFTCEDVLRPFRYARLTTSPGIFDDRAVIESEDLAIRTFFSDDFQNLTLLQVMKLLIFGPRPEELSALAAGGNLTSEIVEDLKKRRTRDYVRYSAGGQSTVQQVERFNVAGFRYDRSVLVDLGPAPASNTSDRLPVYERILRPDLLGVYQEYLDTKVRPEDLGDFIPGAKDLLSPERIQGVEDVITIIGERCDAYPVDAGRLIHLQPTSLSQVSKRALEKEFKGVEGQTTFKSRLFVLTNILERVEFRLYATPKGDIVAEMPLYDFSPEDFGESANGPFGPYAPNYRFERRDIGQESRAFSDGQVRTQFATRGLLIQGMPGAGRFTEAGLPPGVARRLLMIPQFGVRAEQADAPAFVNSTAAAALYSELKLNQINADALTITIDTPPRLSLGPNRPVLVDTIPAIATVRRIQRTIDWSGQSVSQSIDLNYPRLWRGELRDGNRGRRVFRLLGGAAPIDYKTLFETRAESES